MFESERLYDDDEIERLLEEEERENLVVVERATAPNGGVYIFCNLTKEEVDVAQLNSAIWSILDSFLDRVPKEDLQDIIEEMKEGLKEISERL